MTQLQKPLETITKFEADRLVDGRTLNDKAGIVIGPLLALLGGTSAYIWDKYVVKMGTKAIEFQSLFSSAPDIDYDKAFVYLMCAIAALGICMAADSVRDMYISRQYQRNPEKFIRERYCKELVQKLNPIE